MRRSGLHYSDRRKGQRRLSEEPRPAAEACCAREEQAGDQRQRAEGDRHDRCRRRAEQPPAMAGRRPPPRRPMTKPVPVALMPDRTCRRWWRRARRRRVDKGADQHPHQPSSEGGGTRPKLAVARSLSSRRQNVDPDSRRREGAQITIAAPRRLAVADTESAEPKAGLGDDLRQPAQYNRRSSQQQVDQSGRVGSDFRLILR